MNEAIPGRGFCKYLSIHGILENYTIKRMHSSHRTVTAVGVEGLVIVETPDSIMICKKDKAQDVKKIVEKLKEEGRSELL